MAFGIGAGQRNREIFSRSPTPLQLGLGLFVLLLLLSFFVATNKDTATIEGKAVETIEDADNAPDGEALKEDKVDEEKVQQEKQEEGQPSPSQDIIASEDPQGQALEQESLLIGDEVELEEDAYPYNTQCELAILDVKKEIASKKGVLEKADASLEEISKEYEQAKQNVDSALTGISEKRQKLLDAKQSCQATGEPYGKS